MYDQSAFMNKQLLLAFTLVCSGLNAQITINSSDMPNAGDTLRVSYTNDTLDPSLTGANYTWNYAYLVGTSQWVHQFDNPASFTFPFNVLFNPFNTSYGLAQYTPDSIPFLGIQPDNAYAFLRESTSKFRQVGAGLTINTLPIPFNYNPHDTIYRFPMNFGNTDSSYAEYGLNIPGVGYYGQKIARRNIVDGWGTLITPFGSFQTLRVLSLVHQRDTFADTSGIFGFGFDRPLKYEYKWLKTGGKIPYLFVTANDVAGFPVVSNIEFRDSMRSVTQIGVNELQAHHLDFTIYPNPVRDFLIIEIEAAGEDKFAVDILDVSGRLIRSACRARLNTGRYLEVIRLNELSSGIYLVKVQVGLRSGVRKLILQN